MRLHLLLKNYWANLNQIWCVASVARVRRQEIVNFITPSQRGGNFGVKSVKLLYFLKILVVLYVVMMTKEGSTKIVNCMTPGAGILVQGRAI